MAGLNAILSGVSSPFSVSRGDAAGLSQAPPRPQERPVVEEQDLFQSGQWWKNRTMTAGDVAGSGCRCGSCSMCATKAYRDQGASAAPLNSAPDSGEEDEGAAGTLATSGEPTAAGNEERVEATANAVSDLTQGKGSDGEPLSRAELAQLAELKHADAAVRTHEQAHLAAAGGLAKGGASFSYKKGPDGREYAVGGEVQIDTSQGATPEETLTKMMRVRAAALAPASPSPQDRKVAASAASSMSKARQELNIQKVEERVEPAETESSGVENGEQNEMGGKKSAITTRAFSGYQAAARSVQGIELSV